MLLPYRWMMNVWSPRLRSGAALMTLLLVAVIAAVLPGASRADELADARAKADQVQRQLDALDAQVASAAEAYNAAQVQLDETKVKISENKKLLNASQQNLEVSRVELSNMLVDAYRRGDPDIVAFLLTADSIDSLVDQSRFMQRVTAHAANIVRDVRTYSADVKRHAKELQQEKTDRKSAVQSRARERSAALAALAQRQRLLNSLSGRIRAIIQRREAARSAADAALGVNAAAILAGASLGENGDFSVGGSIGGSSDYSSSIPAPASSSSGGAAASAALTQLGTPYVWGGGAPGGFDCSGLIAWAYAQVGISLPHYSAAQYAMGVPVPLDSLEPGDLVSFHGSGHMGIYIGGGQYVHAPQTGDFVKVSMLSDRDDIDGAVRIG